MGPSVVGIRLPRRSLLQSRPPASSSSTRTVAGQVCAFASRPSRNAKSRPRRFCETNPIFSTLGFFNLVDLGQGFEKFAQHLRQNGLSWPQLLASAFSDGKTRIMMNYDSESLDTLLRTPK